MKTNRMKMILGASVLIAVFFSLCLVPAGIAVADEYGATDAQYTPGTPIEDPLGDQVTIGPALGGALSGTGIIGQFFGGQSGGFVNHDIGPLLESQSRGTTQACVGCHTNVVGQQHHMNTTPASGTDCYVCHTKHIACAACHDLGKGGDSVTNALNKPLRNFGTGLQLPPVIDQAINMAPVIDGHKAIAHGGLVLMYAPGDVSGVIDVVRGLTGDDPCYACSGTIDSIDDTLTDASLWKLGDLPLATDGQLLGDTSLEGLTGVVSGVTSSGATSAAPEATTSTTATTSSSGASGSTSGSVLLPGLPVQLPVVNDLQLPVVSDLQLPLVDGGLSSLTGCLQLGKGCKLPLLGGS